MTEVPRIGIVVPTLGSRPEWLRLNLQSVRSQRGAIAVEILLVAPVGNGLGPIAEQYNCKLVEQRGKGLSAAINLGYGLCKNRIDYFSWLGDDDLLAPNSLALAASALAKNSDAAFVFGQTRYINIRGDSIYRSVPTRFAPYYARIGKDLIPQPGSLLRVSSIDWEPLLDESLRNAMDLDLFLRLSSAGSHRWTYIHKELSAYRLHDEAITSNKGEADESESVRGRYVPRKVLQFQIRIRPILNFVERAAIWIQWHSVKSKRFRDQGLYCKTGQAV